MQEIFLSPIIRAPRSPWALRNARTGRVIADRLLTAFDSASRRRGLLGRESLPEGHAMIIAPCSAIHTWGMQFAIDVLFVAGDGLVLKTKAALRPWRLAARPGSFAVVELRAGALERCETARGDRIIITEEARKAMF